MQKYFEWFGLPGSFVLSMLLSLFALVMARIFPTGDRMLCLAAMVFSTMGDIVLMNFKKIGDRMPVRYFYVGAALFMLAHFLYFCALLNVILGSGVPYFNPGFFAAAALVLTTGITVGAAAFKKGSADKKMYLLAIVYMTVIGANCETIFSFAYSAGGTAWIAAVGALSFFISDLLIGIHRLLGITSPRLQSAVWWFYPVGQILILLRG